MIILRSSRKCRLILLHMCFMCACSFVICSLHAVYSVRKCLLFFHFPFQYAFTCVYVCLMCVSCNVWCVSVAFDKGTGWIASTLKPSTWPQRSTGNLNASFPFLLWKYLPLAGKNTYTSCLFTRGMRIPSTCRFSLSGKQILQAASIWCWNEKKKLLVLSLLLLLFLNGNHACSVQPTRCQCMASDDVMACLNVWQAIEEEIKWLHSN